MPKSWIVAVIAIVQITAASAQSTAPNLSFDGFATFGMVYSDEERADFVADTFVSDGAGHRRDWSAEVDSRLGLQLTADFTSRLSAVVQVISEQRYDDSYRPALEWANVRFDPTPHLRLRAGRMVLPFFLASEYRKVGYANPWIRPPQEVYQQAPITNVDGIDFSYQSSFGAFRHTLGGTYGSTDVRFADGGKAEARDLAVIASTLEWGHGTLSASYTRTRLNIDEYRPLFDAFESFGSEGAAIADRYDVQHKYSTTLSVGLRYDPGPWFAMAEWARSRTRTFIGDTHGWYVTAGYRLRSLTSFITVAAARTDSSTTYHGLNAPGTEAIDAALQQLVESSIEQDRVALGLRWDLAPRYALKAQVDHINLGSGSSGRLRNVQPGFPRGSTVSVFSVAVDVVF